MVVETVKGADNTMPCMVSRWALVYMLEMCVTASFFVKGGRFWTISFGKCPDGVGGSKANGIIMAGG